MGKVADEFYLAMEKIGKSNIKQWLRYANFQKNWNEKSLKYLPTKDGVEHFFEVIDFYRRGKIKGAELWIAYASNKLVASKAKLNVYGGDTPSKNRNDFIEMFCSVLTSPNALITSHMGISRSWEAASDLEKEYSTRKKHPYQSLHLHSFAAKVMKLRNPKRIYMYTVPNEVMTKILLKKLPHSIFIGDSFYQKKLNEIEKNPIAVVENWEEQIKRSKGESDEDHQGRIQILNWQAKQLCKSLKCKEKIELLKTNPPRIVIDKGQITILKSDGTKFVTFTNTTPEYQWWFTDPYKSAGLSLPSVLIELEALATVEKLSK